MMSNFASVVECGMFLIRRLSLIISDLEQGLEYRSGIEY